VTPAAGRDYFSVRPPPGVDLDYGAFHGELMAETVLAMMLAQTRGLPLAAGMRSAGGVIESEWPRAKFDRSARPLRGSHVVIAGFGNIGRWVARLAKPFGVRITGVRREPGERPESFDSGDVLLPAERLDEVLPHADHLILTLPGGSATRHFLDERRLSLLPARAVVYNVGRGNAIDEVALVKALRAGGIAGAALDVFETEPLPLDSPLRDCPGVLLLPHAAAISPNYLDLFVGEFVGRYRERYGEG
jgi:phosphoglycerate dehydrogenase-like enzyme